MPELPRLVATDLDGTLLRGDQMISRRTVEALGRITAAGGHVALVTGRPLRWMSHVYEQLGTPVPAVCANGAVVYEPGTDTVLHTTPLLPVALAEVCRRMRSEVPDVVFAVEVSDGRQMRHETTYEVLWDTEHEAVRPITCLDELCAAPAVKLLARCAEPDADTFVARISDCIAGLAEVTHSSYSGIVEISATGVTKAAGLAWLCERLGVTPDGVLAFGDMPNDVPMLTWAGRAVAVANAHPAVRAVADEVTDSNEDEGVAAYLEKLLAQAGG